MPPDEPNAEERLEELSQDYDTPFSIPDDSREVMLSQGGVAFTGGKLDSTHPATDTNIQLEELYDEGVAGAAEASEPNIDDVVTGYDPGASRRRLT